MSIQATVEKVIPNTVYQDMVHQHRVVLRLEDGTRFGGFDADLLCRPSLIGEKRAVDLRGWILMEIRACENPSMNITPNDEDETDWKNHRYEGSIRSLRETDGKIRMGVTIRGGEVKIESNKSKIPSLSAGDGVCAVAGRTDIVGIDDEEPPEEPLSVNEYHDPPDTS